MPPEPTKRDLRRWAAMLADAADIAHEQAQKKGCKVGRPAGIEVQTHDLKIHWVPIPRRRGGDWDSDLTPPKKT